MNATSSLNSVTVTEEDRSTILIVEDDESIADLYSQWLADHHSVRTAADGSDALRVLDESVDVVLLDRRMPEMSGDDVLAAINERGLDPQVIMVTAVKPDFDIIELGFDEYLVKPVERADLVRKVDESLAREAYEQYLKEYYSLTEQRKALEANREPDELESDNEYAEICAQLEEVTSQIESLLDRFEDSHFTAAIERTQTIAALRESEQRYRSMTDDVLDSSRVGTVIVDSKGRVVWANATSARYFGVDRDELLEGKYGKTVEEAIGPALENDAKFVKRVTEALAQNDRIEEFQCHVVAGADREDRWLKHWSKPIESGLYAGGRIEHYYDVTTLKHREKSLETLHAATRRLIDAEATGETTEIAVETADALLEASCVCIYLRDEATGALAPEAFTEEFEEAIPELDEQRPGEGILWEAYVSSDPFVVTEGFEDAPFASELLLPLGSHGVLRVGNGSEGGIPDAQVTLARTLVANTEVALDRAERERTLRRRDQQLKDRNEQLTRLNRINTVIRSIGEALVNASTRAEIEEAVCQRLVDIESYAFVWTGEWDVSIDGVVPRAHAGEGNGILDTLTMAESPAAGRPSRQAIDARAPAVIQNLMDSPTAGGWRDPALQQGFQSVIAIPFVYDESIYGVLEIFADRPRGFDDEEQEVLGELGRMIGHAINSVKRKEALLTGGGIELEFSFPSAGDFFVRLAERGEGRLDLRTVVPQSDGSYITFFAVEDIEAAQVKALADQSTAVEEVRHIRDRGEAAVFKCRLVEAAIVTTIADRGAVPKAVQADESGGHIIVELPQTADVREFAESLTALYDGVELTARRDQAESQAPQTLHERLDDCLTDRQREALQAAYFAGYFEWPRERNGEDIAATLDIAQPTFQQHLRAGERNLFDVLFDGD